MDFVILEPDINRLVAYKKTAHISLFEVFAQQAADIIFLGWFVKNGRVVRFSTCFYGRTGFK